MFTHFAGKILKQDHLRFCRFRNLKKMLYETSPAYNYCLHNAWLL